MKSINGVQKLLRAVRVLASGLDEVGSACSCGARSMVAESLFRTVSLMRGSSMLNDREIGIAEDRGKRSSVVPGAQSIESFGSGLHANIQCIDRGAHGCQILRGIFFQLAQRRKRALLSLERFFRPLAKVDDAANPVPALRAAVRVGIVELLLQAERLTQLFFRGAQDLFEFLRLHRAKLGNGKSELILCALDRIINANEKDVGSLLAVVERVRCRTKLFSPGQQPETDADDDDKNDHDGNASGPCSTEKLASHVGNLIVGESMRHPEPSRVTRE